MSHFCSFANLTKKLSITNLRSACRLAATGELANLPIFLFRASISQPLVWFVLSIFSVTYVLLELVRTVFPIPASRFSSFQPHLFLGRQQFGFWVNCFKTKDFVWLVLADIHLLNADKDSALNSQLFEKALSLWSYFSSVAFSFLQSSFRSCLSHHLFAWK